MPAIRNKEDLCLAYERLSIFKEAGKGDCQKEQDGRGVRHLRRSNVENVGRSQDKDGEKGQRQIEIRAALNEPPFLLPFSALTDKITAIVRRNTACAVV